MGQPKSHTQSRIQLRIQVVAVFIAIAVVVGALLIFMNANTERIVAQNSQYLETSTGQTARRVDDLFTASLVRVQVAAQVYEESLESPEVDPWEAVNVLDLSQFDHAFFVTRDGLAYNSNGETAEATGRYYYTAGVSGESGVCAIENAVFDAQNVIAFFAPVRYEGRVVGVMVCAYRDETLMSFMTSSFFGQPTPTYLCGPDGRIMASSIQSAEMSMIDDVFAEYDLGAATIEMLDADIAAGVPTSFTFHSPDGLGNTYLTKLPTYDWTIMRTFPASITNAMAHNANRAGIILMVGVVVASALVIGALMLQARRQNQQLLLERQEATRIIDASTNLFTSLLSVDFAEGTYEFLKNENTQTDLPNAGPLERLREAFALVDASESSELPLPFFDAERTAGVLPANVPYVQQDWPVKPADGASGKGWFRVSTLCLARDGAGRPTAVLVTIQDVTTVKEQEKAAHEALEDAFRAAEHASKAKSDFLNSMSHDIRTPMNSIMGLTAIASMHIDDPKRVRDCLDNISSASKHLLGLINEVLDMAKIESGSIGLSEEPFNLPETISNIVTIVNPQIAAKSQNLTVDLVNIEHEHVLGDPTRLQQVFMNIMGNAIKFTPEGGDIAVRVTELSSRIPESGCYEFVFSDTGCGMSEEFVKKVFEPFTRANDSRTTKIEGTGLGMAIVKSVVTMMSGTIDVESEVGEGTTFTVMVHLKLRDNTEENLDDLAGVRVLVVDDDSVACGGAYILLNEIGMRPDFRLSGAEGVEAVREAAAVGDPYKVVILDWRMPEMTGLEAALAIREAVPDDEPILILSAYDWTVIEQEAREVGVDAFIAKPMYRSRTVQVMRELLVGAIDDETDDKTLLEELSYAGKRVLLTEDNPMAALIAQEIIGMTGAEVDHAENGSVAVQMLSDHEPHYYDIVFMDIQMPVMNGYEAAAAIRKKVGARPDLGELPIVALSADAFADDVRHAIDSGMSDHMAKPLEIEALVRMLQKWMP